MKPEVKKVLVQARKLIEIGWTRGYFARNSRHDTCSELSDSAVCWCTMGAVMRAAHSNKIGWGLPLDVLREHLPPAAEASFVEFNDRVAKSKKDVLALFDKALAND